MERKQPKSCIWQGSQEIKISESSENSVNECPQERKPEIGAFKDAPSLHFQVKEAKREYNRNSEGHQSKTSHLFMQNQAPEIQRSFSQEEIDNQRSGTITIEGIYGTQHESELNLNRSFQEEDNNQKMNIRETQNTISCLQQQLQTYVQSLNIKHKENEQLKSELSKMIEKNKRIVVLEGYNSILSNENISLKKRQQDEQCKNTELRILNHGQLRKIEGLEQTAKEYRRQLDKYEKQSSQHEDDFSQLSEELKCEQKRYLELYTQSLKVEECLEGYRKRQQRVEEMRKEQQWSMQNHAQRCQHTIQFMISQVKSELVQKDTRIDEQSKQFQRKHEEEAQQRQVYLNSLRNQYQQILNETQEQQKEALLLLNGRMAEVQQQNEVKEVVKEQGEQQRRKHLIDLLEQSSIKDQKTKQHEKAASDNEQTHNALIKQLQETISLLSKQLKENEQSHKKSILKPIKTEQFYGFQLYWATNSLEQLTSKHQRLKDVLKNERQENKKSKAQEYERSKAIIEKNQQTSDHINQIGMALLEKERNMFQKEKLSLACQIVTMQKMLSLNEDIHTAYINQLEAELKQEREKTSHLEEQLAGNRSNHKNDVSELNSKSIHLSYRITSLEQEIILLKARIEESDNDKILLDDLSFKMMNNKEGNKIAQIVKYLQEYNKTKSFDQLVNILIDLLKQEDAALRRSRQGINKIEEMSHDNEKLKRQTHNSVRRIEQLQGQINLQKQNVRHRQMLISKHEKEHRSVEVFEEQAKKYKMEIQRMKESLEKSTYQSPRTPQLNEDLNCQLFDYKSQLKQAHEDINDLTVKLHFMRMSQSGQQKEETKQERTIRKDKSPISPSSSPSNSLILVEKAVTEPQHFKDSSILRYNASSNEFLIAAIQKYTEKQVGSSQLRIKMDKKALQYGQITSKIDKETIVWLFKGGDRTFVAISFPARLKKCPSVILVSLNTEKVVYPSESDNSKWMAIKSESFFLTFGINEAKFVWKSRMFIVQDESKCNHKYFQSDISIKNDITGGERLQIDEFEAFFIQFKGPIM